MIRPAVIATLLIASSALSTGVNAQNIYRCGDSYSQSPCAGGVAVDASDSRTRAQQAQAAADTARARQAANALEKDRLKQEDAAERAARQAPQADAGKPPAAAHDTKPAHTSKKKPKQPPYFTAHAAGEKKDSKKTAKKKNADNDAGNTDSANSTSTAR
jgi:hypothetical protein